jgi:Type ISP C-terminal specificity domain
MRRYLRDHADFGWIVDLSPEGHWSPARTRIFPSVPHPVCIGIFACDSDVTKSPPEMKYLAISGDQREKFEELKNVSVKGSGWVTCADGATASLRSARLASWLQYPAIEDLLPYTSLGVTCNRAWVRAPETEVLARRWRRLIMADPEEKRALMKETRDRTIDKLVPAFPGGHIALPLRIETSPVPRIERIGFRSFDRQYLIADQRVVDFLRPDLWRLRGEKQVFLVTQLRESLTSGPAVVFSAEVPDTH